MLSILLPGIWDTVFNSFVYFQGYWIFREINYRNVASTLIQRCFKVVCLLGVYLNFGLNLKLL